MKPNSKPTELGKKTLITLSAKRGKTKTKNKNNNIISNFKKKPQAKKKHVHKKLEEDKKYHQNSKQGTKSCNRKKNSANNKKR